MKKTYPIAFFAFVAHILSPLTSAVACGNPGKDGDGTPVGIINTYYPGTANVAAGAMSMTLGASAGSATTIAVGDMVLIMQMQDATFNATNTAAYGDGQDNDILVPSNPSPNAASGSTSLGNSGLYEFAVANSAVGSTGGTLSLTAPLVNTYTNASETSTLGQKRVQVVRVPQYRNATLSGTVTSFPWNGAVGGIVVMDVLGKLNFNGQTIDVSAQGFRGGRGDGRKYQDVAPFHFAVDPDLNPADNTAEFWNEGFKGEGIGGSPTDMWNGATIIDLPSASSKGYPTGNRGMGAPSNAGGGGSVDSAGGGGANGGAGGRGGDEYCPDGVGSSTNNVGCGFTNDESSPDHQNGAHGGLGGIIASGLSATRMVMGGGGGGGADHGGKTGHGGPGGGIIFIRAGATSGNGMLNANGSNGNAHTLDATGNGGGGGAGGTIYVNSGTSLSTVIINAKGGTGTNVTNHAPGGGGGGGVVYQSGGALSAVSGGNNGTRSLKNPMGSVNATGGSTGLSSSVMGNPPGASSGTNCLPQLTVTKVTTTPSRKIGTDTTATYTITVANVSGKSTATGVNVVDDLPSPFTYNGLAVSPVYSGGTTGPASITGSGTDPVVFGTAGGTSSNSFSIPGGGSVSLSFTVLLNGASVGTYQNPATANFSDSTSSTAGATATPGGTYASGAPVSGSNYSSGSSAGEDITLSLPPTPSIEITKASAVVSDPFNGTIDPKRIPGALIDYTLTVKNTGVGTPDNNAVVITDPIPSDTALFVQDLLGSGPVVFVQGTPSSSLSYTFTSLSSTTDDLSFSSNGGSTYAYTPVPDTNNVDAFVTHMKVSPKGTFAGGSNFQLRFRVRIK
jgi:uncharacterized repeat protein (TIGR01451 family)